MDSRAAATATPVRIKLANTWFTARIWRQSDFAFWEEYVRDEFRKRMYASLSEEKQEKICIQVQEKAARLSFGSIESQELLISPVGFIKAWWIALRHDHPELDEETIGQFLLHPDTDYKELEKMTILARSSGKKQFTKKKKRKKRV